MERFSFFGGSVFLRLLDKVLRLMEIIRPKKHKSHLSFVLHGAGLVFILRVVGYGLTYICQLMLARWIGQFEFGIYAYSWTWVKVLAVFGSVGLDRMVLRFVPQYIAQKKWDLAAGMLTYGWQLVVIGSIIISAISGLGILLFKESIHEYYRLPLFIAFCSVPLIAVIIMRRDVARAFGKAAFAYFPRMILFPAILIIISLVMMAFHVKFSATHVLSTVFFILFAVLIFQLIVLKKITPTEISQATPAHEIRVWLRVAFPIFIMTGFNVALTHTSVLMLGGFLEPKDVAVYFAAERISDLVNFVLVAVNALGAPKIAFLYAKKNQYELQKFISGTAKWIFWSSTTCAILLIISGEFLLSMFGANFAMGSNVLYILIFGQLVNASAGSVGYMMVMTGHQDNAAWLFGSTAVLNIILNAILIPQFGTMGAAYATAISLILRNLVAFIMVKRLTGIHTFAFFVPSIKEKQ